MSTIRAATPEDAEQISDLFRSAFRDGLNGETRELTDYLAKLYLQPGDTAGIDSLVHDDDGRVTGFLGVYPVPMTFKKRPVVAAVCGSLVVLDPHQNAMAAPRMLKKFLGGPQDLSLSETANKISYALWTGYGGNALLDYSLKWHRPIFPLAYAMQMASEKSRIVSGLLPVIKPIGKLLDRLILAMPRPRPKDSVSAEAGAIPTLEAMDSDEFFALYAELTRQFDPKPVFEKEHMAEMLADAQQKPLLGQFFLKKVLGKSGRTIGAVAYHFAPGGIMHVLQMLARPKTEAEVLDALIAHARQQGAIGIIGRTQPNFLLAMQGRKTYFLVHDWTVVHSKQKDIVAAYCGGDGFVNGFVGEYWNRLNNGI